MTPEENDLRRALSERSGEATPEFRARLKLRLAASPRASNWIALVAFFVVTALTVASIGALLYSRHARSGLVASGSRLVTPTQSSSPVEQSPSPASSARLESHRPFRRACFPDALSPTRL